MNYNSYDMGAYKLHIVKTTKFKTITINVCFRSKINKEDIGYRNILKDVLLNSNNTFKNEIDLIKETENLYDLKLFASSSRIGNFSNLSFKTRFLNEKYTEKGMNEESIRFLFDVIFNPNIDNNSFKEDIVQLSKERLIKEKNSVRDNKVKYALLSLLEKYENKPYSYNPYGDNIENINGENLYEYYQNMIKNDIVDIFIVGDIDSKKVKEILKECVKLSTFHKKEDNLIVEPLDNNNNIKKYEMRDNVNQSQLLLLYNINELSDFERKYVLLLYNEILGGSPSSVLFEIVREKHSYAYYINSLVKMYDNILMVYSGIGNGNEEEVIKLINKITNDIRKGKVNEDKLNIAKSSIISSIVASTDSPVGIINTCFAREIAGSDDAETRIENINKVTINDIIKLSSKIKLYSILTLKGEENGD